MKKKLLFETVGRFFRADNDLLNEICTKDLIVLGTSIDEEVHTLKGFQDYQKRIEETKKDIKRNTIRKLVFHKITSGGNGALFIFHARSHNISADIETSFFQRVTMGLVFENDKWKIDHVHFAKVDKDQEEDDPFHFSEVKRKNEELQRLVIEKTEDLTIKNRDLEIEASLERVRTVSIGMVKADDLLNICEVLFKELRHLGFSEMRNAMINIHDDAKVSFLNYDYSDAAGATVTTIFYNSHPATLSLVKQIRKANDAFAEFEIKGSQLKEWRKYRKKMGEQDDPRLDKVASLHYYFYSIGIGGIGISAYGPISKEKLNLLKRFRNVFNFAYRRYMDVALAESQAREVQIELGLEKVRAVAMSMLKPNDLLKVCESVFK